MASEFSCPWLGQDYFQVLSRARKLGEAPVHVIVSRPPFAGLASGRLMVIGVRPFKSASAPMSEGGRIGMSGEAAESGGCAQTAGSEWILSYSNFERAPRRPRVKS
ncbi:hypothetical protein IJT93_03605 [bacterium]|nr:hypothetical protein [bacterium]